MENTTDLRDKLNFFGGLENASANFDLCETDVLYA